MFANNSNICSKGCKITYTGKLFSVFIIRLLLHIKNIRDLSLHFKCLFFTVCCDCSIKAIKAWRMFSACLSWWLWASMTLWLKLSQSVGVQAAHYSLDIRECLQTPICISWKNCVGHSSGISHLLFWSHVYVVRILWKLHFLKCVPLKSYEASLLIGQRLFPYHCNSTLLKSYYYHKDAQLTNIVGPLCSNVLATYTDIHFKFLL